MLYETKEFKVNEYITLKLENNKTNIYIKEELFLQCKSLIINLPASEIDEDNSFCQITSIDEAADFLTTSEDSDDYTYKITPEVEFWAHSSNLQAWCEHNYDTRLLHSNLAFAFLKRLDEIGDLLAKKKLKEEIAKRFVFGNNKVQDFLKIEGYLDFLSKEEVLSLVKGSDIIFKLEQLSKQKLEINTLRYPNPRGMIIKDGEIRWLSLDNSGLAKLPEIMKGLKMVKGLMLQSNSLGTLPDWIKDFKLLEYLYVSNNQLKNLPDSIGSLKKLKRLDLNDNQLEKLPDSIGNLFQLEDLFLGCNNIEILPESIGNLKLLKNLIIPSNLLETLPDSIGDLGSLESLYLSENPISRLPRTLNNLRNLKVIYLKGIDENKWNLTDYFKKKIKIYK